MKNEIPMRVVDLRAELKIGTTQMCAIRRHLGLPKNSRWMLKSAIVRVLRDEPDFTQTKIYPRQRDVASK